MGISMGKNGNIEVGGRVWCWLPYLRKFFVEPERGFRGFYILRMVGACCREEERHSKGEKLCCVCMLFSERVLPSDQ